MLLPQSAQFLKGNDHSFRVAICGNHAKIDENNLWTNFSKECDCGNKRPAAYYDDIGSIPRCEKPIPVGPEPLSGKLIQIEIRSAFSGTLDDPRGEGVNDVRIVAIRHYCDRVALLL
jgi:hypothetical protein